MDLRCRGPAQQVLEREREREREKGRGEGVKEMGGRDRQKLRVRIGDIAQ